MHWSWHNSKWKKRMCIAYVSYGIDKARYHGGTYDRRIQHVVAITWCTIQVMSIILTILNVRLIIIFPITRIKIQTKTITKTLTLTITFPRAKTLTRTLTFTRIWINSNVRWISHMYDSVALCTARRLILESLNHRIFYSIFVYVSLSTLSMIQQVTLHSRLL